MYKDREPLMVEFEMEAIKLIKYIYYFYNFADPLDQYNMCEVVNNGIEKLTKCLNYIKRDIDTVNLRGEPPGSYYTPQFTDKGV